MSGNKEREKKEEVKYISYDEAKKLIVALKKDLKSDYISRYMILLALYTGMRFAEILGLTWDSIDLKNKTILIDKSLDYKYTHDFIPTKNKEARTIKTNDTVIALLNDLPKNDMLVFKKKDGKMPSNTAVNKSLLNACKRANIKRITFHALRHTHGSILLYKGVSILYISKRLGHASTDITQQVYLHLIDELKEKEDALTNTILSQL